MFSGGGPGVAHHHADIFLFEPGSDRYLGRLCGYAQCPKGKSDCLTPGCGLAPFLKQHEGFSLYLDALAPDRTVPLFDRAAGLLRLAADLDAGTP
ncbi:MAG: hypothetical protein H0X27_06575 [Caulobacteraceae bacterium]|nr:hypothetical protein [Caulobacteraceae bacterium]